MRFGLTRGFCCVPISPAHDAVAEEIEKSRAAVEESVSGKYGSTKTGSSDKGESCQVEAPAKDDVSPPLSQQTAAGSADVGDVDIDALAPTYAPRQMSGKM